MDSYKMLPRNGVFISYRREPASELALAIYQNLKVTGIDAFLDIDSIGARQFDTVILNQIASRPYFLPILTPRSLDRCVNAGDWLLKEIQYAMEHKRLIVPLHTPDFDFADIKRFLPEPVADELLRWDMEQVDITSPRRFLNDMQAFCEAKLVPVKDIFMEAIPFDDLSIIESIRASLDKLTSPTVQELIEADKQSPSNGAEQESHKSPLTKENDRKTSASREEPLYLTTVYKQQGLERILNFSDEELRSNQAQRITYSQMQKHYFYRFRESALMQLGRSFVIYAGAILASILIGVPFSSTSVYPLFGCLVSLFGVVVMGYLIMVVIETIAIKYSLRAGKFQPSIGKEFGILEICSDGQVKFNNQPLLQANIVREEPAWKTQVELYYYVFRRRKYALSAQCFE